jgi:hypothetical protein
MLSGDEVDPAEAAARRSAAGPGISPKAWQGVSSVLARGRKFKVARGGRGGGGGGGSALALLGQPPSSAASVAIHLTVCLLRPRLGRDFFNAHWRDRPRRIGTAAFSVFPVRLAEDGSCGWWLMAAGRSGQLPTTQCCGLGGVAAAGAGRASAAAHSAR